MKAYSNTKEIRIPVEKGSGGQSVKDKGTNKNENIKMKEKKTSTHKSERQPKYKRVIKYGALVSLILLITIILASIVIVLVMLVFTSTGNTTQSRNAMTADACSGILTNHLSATSGYYNITQANGTVITAYCDMEGVNCGDGEGGWMRVAYLNMSDPSEQCPPGFRLYQENGVRACGRPTSLQGCLSITFPTYNISYTQVCGRVTGYQKGEPDAIGGGPDHTFAIDGPYVDGVSITRGSNPRKHIWTFMASQTEYVNDLEEFSGCPCAATGAGSTRNRLMMDFGYIQDDYFCESGNPSTRDSYTFFSNDPLWDGKQCGSIEEPCCNVTGIPWFNKVLQQPSTDYIELRVCTNWISTIEDPTVNNFEIYIK